MNGVTAKIARQLIILSFKVKPPMPNAARPGHHGIGTPGDHRGMVCIMIDQPGHAVASDLYDTSTCFRCNIDNECAVANLWSRAPAASVQDHAVARQLESQLP